MSEPRKLRIVPYDPNDYSLGEALGKEHGTTFDDPNFIGSALSLYFQWEEYRSCVLYSDGPQSGRLISCTLDYDRDERTPTEIRVTLAAEYDQANLTIREFQKLYLRFEIFRSCYEFQCEVLAVSQNPKEDGWALIVTIPASLLVYKTRRLPRIMVDESTRKTLPTIAWSSAASPGSKNILEVSDLGLKAISSKTIAGLQPGTGTLTIGENTFNRVEHSIKNEKSVFLLKFTSAKEFGEYFDFYRKVAYPSLRSRYEVSFDAGLKLYTETNYFGKFSSDEIGNIFETIKNTWTELRSGLHKTIADYYIADEQEALTGASSLALSFYDEATPVWIFHQLCAFQKPDLLESSGQLYSWRAEYLAARPEPLSVGVWFDGNSRWLERIYVKFAGQTTGATRLEAIKLDVCTLKTQPNKSNVELQTYNMGSIIRHASNSKNVWAAAGPAYLNASGLLDCIVLRKDDGTLDDINNYANCLAIAQKRDELVLRVSVPDKTDISSLNGSRAASNRFCFFPKEDLIDFLNSVEHSVAITRRKLANE